ncbi:mRNA export factor GLE1 [Hylaeus anthracinus]|uniref:mRNA export factor GLE1 n=1 Tax=Hylaeus anthracinus TaxID=313031 RepID=UPI0023B97C7C|nr:mRNA export factor GLE1 [Hylaeus anthracinus]
MSLNILPKMPHSKHETPQITNDIASDFTSLKVSALKKAFRISGNIDSIKIGPDLTPTENEIQQSENTENEQNSCNIKDPSKSIHSQNNKISLQSGIAFSVNKIFLESENQRKEEVWKEIERHWQNMRENGKAIKEHMAISRFYLAKERERRSKENYAYILAEERIAEQEEIRRKHERHKELEEYKKQMKEKEELAKSVLALRETFRAKYCELITLSASSYSVKLQDLLNQEEAIHEKVQTGEATAIDLNSMKKMVELIDEMLCAFKLEAERINAQYEADLANMESAKQCHFQPICDVVVFEQTSTDDTQSNEDKYGDSEPLENVHVTENVTVLNIPQVTPVVVNKEEIVSLEEHESMHENNLYKYVDKESLQRYMDSQQFLDYYANSYNDFVQAESTRKFRFECQKAINIPVNAISGINEQHLRDKYERLHNLLTGRAMPNVNEYPQGIAFCKNILAKKIVSQGETLVSSKPKMAFPIAAVVVALWNDHSDFGDLLLSHFHSACPFTVPVFLPKMVDQSDESYYTSLGYKYNEDGTLEKYDKFLKRMSGLMRLYTSIIITSQRKGINKSNPHGLQYAWRWLAVVLNTEPRTEVADICATLLLDMLEVAGNLLWTAYPNQFPKLLMLLSEKYYPCMQSVGCVSGGPLVRLQEFLKNSLTNGSVPPPDGRLPPNFW